MDDTFLVAYEALVGLKPQVDKITKVFSINKENYFVCGYAVDFDFYFLDEDGYCLKKISTGNQKKLYSPGAYPFCIKAGNKPELMKVVLVDEKISSSLSRRIKTVCYFPVFSVNSGSQKG